jgi:hypothetical protein
VSLRVPLSVRLRTSRRDIHVTAELADLQYTSTSPGGYENCTIRLHRPLSFTPLEVAQFGRLYVYASTGIVWEGRLQDPGRTAGDEGEVYEIAAVGGSAHLQDDTRQLIYVDADPANWDRIDAATAAAEVQQLADTGAVAGSDTPALSLRIPQGTSVDGAIPSRAVAAHRGIAAAGLKMAHVSFLWDAGLTSANLTASLYAATEGVGAADIAWSATFNIAGGSQTRVVSTDWTNGRNRPIVRFHYTAGAASVSADTWWLQLTDLVVRTLLLSKDGTERLAGGTYTAPTVTAFDVVNDLLGRVLVDTIDGTNATVDATSFPIEHLAYPDGVTAAQVLDDLIKFEQAYTWHVWKSNPDNNDLFGFEWVAWPTSARYEADVIDGFSAPASGNTVYDQVAVRWHNRGTIRVSLRTQTVTALDDAGFSRTAFIDLGDEASTQANAHRVGDQFLAEHQYPLNAGRLTIRRPIVDLVAGRMVQPWELRAGYLIRVRGVESYPDSLNVAGRNGVTVFKVAAVSYSASDNTATLDLDTFAPSVARAMATLARRPPARRR